ncbi:MAG: WG repeat-containing protein [Proteobacteria bacterium]|nr:WG repeat-containing protein [Pseudomonadota bacterium]
MSRSASWLCPLALVMSAASVMAEVPKVVRHEIWDAGGNGFVDETGKVVIKPQFATVMPFSEGFACVQLGTNRWAFIDASGKRLGSSTFESCEAFAEGNAKVQTAKGIGYVTTAGKLWFVPPFGTLKVEDSGGFHDGLAPVRVGAKWGYVDAKGAWIIPPTYGPAVDYAAWQKRLAKACPAPDPGEMGAPSEACMAVTSELDFDAAREFSDGLAPVRVGMLWGFIDPHGAMVIAPSYADAPSVDRGSFFEGRAVVAVDANHYGYIDHKGAVVAPGPYARAGRFHDGLAAVFDTRWHYIDLTGKSVLDLGPDYTIAQEFHEGLAVVATKRRGYIDRTGKVVIPMVYETSGPFVGGGVSLSVLNGNMPLHGVIGRDGKPLWVERGDRAAWAKATKAP